MMSTFMLSAFQPKGARTGMFFAKILPYIFYLSSARFSLVHAIYGYGCLSLLLFEIKMFFSDGAGLPSEGNLWLIWRAWENFQIKLI